MALFPNIIVLSGKIHQQDPSDANEPLDDECPHKSKLFQAL